MKTLKSFLEKNTRSKGNNHGDFKAEPVSILVVVIISFFFVHADLKAQPDKTGINFKISEYGNTTAKTDPAVAYNSKDDEYFVVWSDKTNKQVWGRILNGSDPANSTTNSFRIDGGYAIETSRPAVAYNPDDNQYFVIWETNDLCLTGRAYDANGDELDATTIHYSYGHNARVEYCPDNKQYLIVYLNGNSVMGFWVSASYRFGSSVSFVVGTSKLTISGDFDLAKGSDQYFMAVWRAQWDYNNEDYTGIRGNFIHATNKQSSKSFQISWYDGQWYGAKDPAVAFDADTKKYLVIWRDTRHHQSASDNHSIYGQYVDQATSEQYHQSNFQVVPKSMTTDVYNPDLVFDKAHDSFLASWDQGDIYGQMIQDTILVGSSVPISTAANTQNAPQLVYNSTREETLCVWEDHRFSPSEIYGQRLGITQTITVDKPAAGDVWDAGSTRYIRWHCKNFTGQVRIAASYNGYAEQYWQILEQNTANDGTCEWIVPNYPSKNCVIMIVDAADGSPKGYSGLFEIPGSTSSITVTSPNGGEIWQAGTQQNITWTGQGIDNYDVKIEYSTNNGASYNFVSYKTNHGTSGSYAWTVPNTPSAQCLVRLSVLLPPAISDVSDAAFTITQSAKQITFIGNAYQGIPPDKSVPLGNAYFEFYGDDDEWPDNGPKDKLAAGPLGGSGDFTLVISPPPGYNYFHFIETDPAGTVSSGAQADPPGYVKNFNCISFKSTALIPGSTYKFAFWDNQGSTGNTSTGDNVTVLLNDNFTLTFDEVTAAGNTTMETSQTGPEPPDSLVVFPYNNPLYYDISTTAGYTGSVNLTIQYDDAGMTPEMEEHLIIMHYIEATSGWLGITTSVDTDQNLVHGVTDQFSVFAIMVMIEAPAVNELTVTHCDDTGPGSLHEAINYANGNPGRDTIRFNIPKDVPGYDSDIGVWMIAPQSELPTITESLYIEGFSQQAFIGEDSNPFGPEIWLYGEIAGQSARGLVSTTAGTYITGLIISQFQNAGIMFLGVDGGSISGCYVGVDFSGNASAGNGYGIWMTNHTRNIEIAPFDTLKNIISGNTYDGVVVADTSGIISIMGNIIGLNRTGTATIGNQGHGIVIASACDSVDVYDNWIGGNESGIYIMGSYNSVRNNFIGSRKVNNEILELGNETNGIYLLTYAHDNLITENFIRFNGNCGVYVEGANAINNKVSQNHISGSGSGYGIYNASGGNKELAPPEISGATASSVTGTAVPDATVEIYTDPGNEGLMFQGEVNADAGGSFTLSGTIKGAFTNVTAIAIDDKGNTSMFSEVAIIGSTSNDELTVINCNNSGPGSLRNAMIYANGNPGPDTIRFNIPKGVAGFDTILGVCEIEPQSQLPTISESLFIDGFSQKAFMDEDSNPLGPEIWLNGKEAGDYAYGLKSTAASTDIAGLAIGNFHTGIFMEGVDGGRISGCYIGVDFTGDTAAANVYGIILCYQSRNIMIAPYDTFPNVVSGNTHGGIMISDTSDHITVTGNLVGLNRSGRYIIPNENNAGIRIGTACDSVEVFDNLIGGNQSGIMIWGSYNTVHDNFIGLNPADGKILELGNNEGIYLSEEAQHNLITNNVICFNSIHGVTINGANTLYNKVSHNQISENGWGYGIYNQSGGNAELAPPVISAATSSSVTGTAGPNATVEIYTDPKNEGLIFQGEVKADASGNFTWNGTITGTYANVTAITIDDNGNTSMFSDAVTIDGMTDIEDLYRINDHSLSLSYPNPFYQGAVIRFTIPDYCMVTLQIYDLMGREVDIPVHETMIEGEYSIEWERNADCAAGIYLVTLQAGGSVQTKKLILQK